MNTYRLLPALSLVLLAGTADADPYHYRSILVGDRAAGLGAAYTAVSDDPSGLYYNPAGVVYAGENRLSASVNAYHSATITYDDVLGGGEWTRESSALLPNFFGIVQPLGKGVVGFSYAVPDSISENQDQRLTNVGSLSEFVINVNNDDNTYKIGPSYARSIGNDLSLGGTLYFHVRDSEAVVNQESFLINGTWAWQNSYLEITEYGVEPVLGVMWSPAEKWALGLSLRKTIVLDSDGRSQITCASDIAAVCGSTPSYTITTFDDHREYPLTVAVGAAYFPSERLMYSADFIYYDEADGLGGSDVDSPFRTRAATFNFSLGAEYFLSPDWAMRTGLFTNNANTPMLESGDQGQPEHIDMLGFSLTLSRFTRSSSITGGLSYAAGTGEAQAVEGVTDIQDARAQQLTLFLSTSYNY